MRRFIQLCALEVAFGIAGGNPGRELGNVGSHEGNFVVSIWTNARRRWRWNDEGGLSVSLCNLRAPRLHRLHHLAPTPTSPAHHLKMSLSLVQGYESPEEEEAQDYLSDSDEEYAGEGFKETGASAVKPSKLQDEKPPPRTSDLPTAFEMFTEVTGPPDFLKHSVTVRVNGDLTSMTPTDFSRAYVAPKQPKPKPKHAPTAVAVVQAKPQVSNVEQDAAKAVMAAKKRAPGADFPPAEDAANLLRMCPNCGVPKTYSGAKEAMVCPVCGDRPVVAGAEEKSKRGNKVKDKEHSKRMKGQSAHSTWKSETEMQLRQQFD